MSCEVVRGDTGDTVQFSRSGVSGALEVRADRFQLTARLGFLLGAFSQKLEREIARNLDSLLDTAALKPTAVSAVQAPVKLPDEGAGPFRSSSRASTRRKPRTTG